MGTIEPSFRIKFGKSTSSYYNRAVRYAKRFDHFTEVNLEHPYNEIIADREELVAKSNDFSKLIDIISGWKTTEYSVDDAVVDFSEIKKYLDVFNCHQQYKAAVLSETHCYIGSGEEGWGCKFLMTINRHLNPATGYYHRYEKNWYDFGSFLDENTWKVDNQKIREVSEREIDLCHVEVCDAFRRETVLKRIKELPETINLIESDRWEVQYQEFDDGAHVAKRAIGIRLERVDSYLGTSIAVGLGQANETKSPVEEEKRYIPDVTFEDIGGIDDIIQTIREVIELPIKNPSLFEYLKIKPHRGVLLFGPPGCGKTMIAKAIANEINAHFISVKGPELISKWYGQSEENLRGIFEEASEQQPSIVFFDEIDSIAQVRSGEENLRFDSRFVNQLLTLMDGIEDYGNICVIASTNRPELLDPALLRPGRFDYKLEVTMPTLEGGKEIFRLAIKEMPIEPDFDLYQFSTKLFGLSGADIAYVAREGAYNCLRRIVDLKRVIEDDQTVDLESVWIDESDFEKALQSLMKDHE